MQTYAQDVHALANRVARASRLAGSPINYYHAVADIRAQLETRALQDMPAFYERFYGSKAWTAATPA